MFWAQLELAKERRLPVVIHNRAAESDILEILRAHAGSMPKDWRPWGVMHCFSGDEKFAFDCLEIGLLISYTGILTFKNATALRDVAKKVPLDSVMLETDAPYLAPMPHRGKRNEPSYVPLIAETLAQVKGVSVEEVSRATTRERAAAVPVRRRQDMNSKRWILIVRLLIAVILGFCLLRRAQSTVAHGDIASAFFIAALMAMYGIVLFLLFGFSFIGKVAERFGNFYEPPDSNFRIMPEYSVAEARVNKGKYQEAVDEYRKVIVAHPDDVYPHLRIADLALKHLNDVKLAELELQSALGKATGEDTTALAAGRLADVYQHTLHDVTRALDVMKQLREKIPDTKQAKLAEERITTLERLAKGETVLPVTPEKIAPRPSRYKMPE